MSTMRIGEIATRFAVTKEVVLRWIKSGDLTAINVSSGGRAPRYRVSPEAVEAFVASRHTGRGGEGDGKQ